ncbi:MAG TPA: AraC family transcriptional regulator [Casimicrobiaceae bacterium]|nr:AraC family transcriptional regulator [Casimicrobiaceae bacterium]
MLRSTREVLEFGSRALSATEPTQHVGALSQLPALIRQLGADPVKLLAQAGLAPDALDEPGQRISYSALGRFLRESADSCNCGHLGLLAGRMWHLADLGVAGEIVANSATVGEALQSFAMHQHLNSDGGLAYLMPRGETVELGYAIYGTAATGRELIYDTALAVGFNVLREICGPDFVPAEVLFPHAAPPDIWPYRNVFRVSPRFNSEVCALRFPVHWMNRPVEGADPRRLRAAQQRAAQAGSGPLLQQVHRALRVMLLSGKSSGDALAGMLSMHRRTLNRRLRAEGVTIQQVLDQTRFAVARELLAGSRVSLDDVAATLGYSGVSAFMRTFRRWSGTTPGRWRREAARRSDAAAPRLVRGVPPEITGEPVSRTPASHPQSEGAAGPASH